MKVTEKDVSYVADLANLELTEQERARMVRDLNSILGHVDSLNELDTKNVPPMAQVSDRFGLDDSKQRSATTFTRACASRCRMMSRWRTLRTLRERSSKCQK